MRIFGIHRPSRRYLFQVVAVALLYLVAARLGLSLALTTKQVTTIWPPTGIALAITLLGGYRFLPGIAIGAFVANIMTREPVLVAAGITLGNTLEAFTGTYLLTRLIRFRPQFATTKDLTGFILCASLLSPAASASPGTLSLAAGGLITWPHLGAIWTTWWAGDGLGSLIFGLAIFVWCQPAARAVLRRAPLETGFVLALVLAVSVVVFTGGAGAGVPLPLAAYLIFPLLSWCAFRLQQIGVATAAVILTLVAVTATLQGLGPFVGNALTAEANLIYLQLFVTVTSVSAMFLAITVARHREAERELRAVTAQLREANDRVTHILENVLERGLHS